MKKYYDRLLLCIKHIKNVLKKKKAFCSNMLPFVLFLRGDGGERSDVEEEG